MFSPTHTPPPESSSEDEEEADFPLIDVGTPKKPKLESDVKAKQTQPTELSVSTAASPTSSSGSSCTTNCAEPSTTTTAISAPAVSPSRRELPPVQSNINYRQKLEKAKKEFQSLADGLKDASPIKLEDSRATSESKRTAMKVKKLSKILQGKTDMERKVSYA